MHKSKVSEFVITMHNLPPGIVAKLSCLSFAAKDKQDCLSRLLGGPLDIFSRNINTHRQACDVMHDVNMLLVLPKNRLKQTRTCTIAEVTTHRYRYPKLTGTGQWRLHKVTVFPSEFFWGGISNFLGGKFPPQRCLE